MKINSYIIAACLLAGVACSTNDDNNTLSPDDLEISMGSQCGWCGENDSLIITNEQVNYETNNLCNDPDIKIEITTNEDDWNQLLDSLNWNDFKSIEINTCYYCADGCDTWISIKNQGVVHSIRFGTPDSLTVNKIKPLINKLDQIKYKITHRSKADNGYTPQNNQRIK